jgi:glycosyltransferase involved in cell wall biosynthesis
MRLGYLYSRYPVISQTFCDAEMLALEGRGIELVIGSVYPPLTSLRHEYIARLHAPIHYAPPQEILRILERSVKTTGKWPRNLVEEHDRKYGPGAKAELRARNALYFANFFTRSNVDHVHVHFANRAAHTALFLKEISGIPFSVTAHGQDFMKDLGSDNLLREICAAAEFVAAETDYSRDLLRQRCPASAAKIHRVYNGIDLKRFSMPRCDPARPGIASCHFPQIVSVGRLVAFKGFEDLIDACAELQRRAVDFICEIIGDGPLREVLQAKIEQLDLSSRVRLLGSLSQNAVLEKLQAADVFALASTTDTQGATDIFPTVILEAMASARPVVSTRLAGIPELVLDGNTGILVSPGDTTALARALAPLLLDPGLRVRYGRAGRARIEQHFQIEDTVAPLLKLFEITPHTAVKSTDRRASESEAAPKANQIAYLIDRWPNNDVPLLQTELREMRQREVPMVSFVCELDSSVRLDRAMEQLAPSLEFLPDAIVIEAEWRANPAVAQRLEEERAQQTNRVPGGVFLRQARFALVLQRMLRQQNVSHVHATSAQALVCAVILKRLLNVTVSATIEPRPGLPRAWLHDALGECVATRLNDRKLLEARHPTFMPDKTSGLHLTRRAKFWQQWAELLLRWSCSDRKSKIENRK